MTEPKPAKKTGAELKLLAEQHGIPIGTLRKRHLELNWPIERAIMKNPPKKRSPWNGGFK